MTDKDAHELCSSKRHPPSPRAPTAAAKPRPRPVCQIQDRMPARAQDEAAEALPAWQPWDNRAAAGTTGRPALGRHFQKRVQNRPSLVPSPQTAQPGDSPSTANCPSDSQSRAQKELASAKPTAPRTASQARPGSGLSFQHLLRDSAAPTPLGASTCPALHPYRWPPPPSLWVGDAPTTRAPSERSRVSLGIRAESSASLSHREGWTQGEEKWLLFLLVFIVLEAFRTKVKFLSFFFKSSPEDIFPLISRESGRDGGRETSM